MKINYNATAMIAKQALERNNSMQNNSTMKLSTGLKIMSAKDDAAGYAVSRRMKAQIRGLDSARASAGDGVSVAEIADGAFSVVHSILQRMNELAVKGANGTMIDSDRVALSEEIEQLKDEINRIGSETEFNGQTLMDGNFDLKGYTDAYGVYVDDYTDAVPAGVYSFSLTGVGTNAFAASMTVAPDVAGGEEFFNNAVITTKEDAVTVTDGRGKTIEFFLDLDRLKADNGGTVPANLDINLDIKSIGEMNVQVGASEGQLLKMRIPVVSIESLNLDKIDFSTQTSCQQTIAMIADASAQVSSIRSRIGAYQNRLEGAMTNLDVSSDNMTSAYSRIMDVDMAAEMTEYYTSQILVQAGTSVLAQANSQPEQILQLLQ